MRRVLGRSARKIEDGRHAHGMAAFVIVSARRRQIKPRPPPPPADAGWDPGPGAAGRSHPLPSAAQPPESPGGGAGGGSSTAQVKLSEVPGATMQTSVATVTWWCLLKVSGTGETTPLYLVFNSCSTTASGSSTVPTSWSAWAYQKK